MTPRLREILLGIVSDFEIDLVQDTINKLHWDNKRRIHLLARHCFKTPGTQIEHVTSVLASWLRAVVTRQKTQLVLIGPLAYEKEKFALGWPKNMVALEENVIALPEPGLGQIVTSVQKLNAPLLIECGVRVSPPSENEQLLAEAKQLGDNPVIEPTDLKQLYVDTANIIFRRWCERPKMYPRVTVRTIQQELGTPDNEITSMSGIEVARALRDAGWKETHFNGVVPFYPPWWQWKHTPPEKNELRAWLR